MSTVVEQELMQVQPNNNQIDNTSYYRLPCGKYLEDFIAWECLSFAEGSALKYLWRAGKKDGESFNKDIEKFSHYCAFMSSRNGESTLDVRIRVNGMYRRALSWNGRES